MTKYYKVIKDNFLWKEGAILKHNNSSGSDGGYSPIEDIWNTTPVNGTEYISSRIIEHEGNLNNFQRVYPDTIGGKLYRSKDQLISTYKDSFK